MVGDHLARASSLDWLPCYGYTDSLNDHLARASSLDWLPCYGCTDTLNDHLARGGRVRVPRLDDE